MWECGIASEGKEKEREEFYPERSERFYLCRGYMVGPSLFEESETSITVRYVGALPNSSKYAVDLPFFFSAQQSVCVTQPAYRSVKQISGMETVSTCTWSFLSKHFQLSTHCRRGPSAYSLSGIIIVKSNNILILSFSGWGLFLT